MDGEYDLGIWIGIVTLSFQDMIGHRIPSIPFHPAHPSSPPLPICRYKPSPCMGRNQLVRIRYVAPLRTGVFVPFLFFTYHASHWTDLPPPPVSLLLVFSVQHSEGAIQLRILLLPFFFSHFAFRTPDSVDTVLYCCTLGRLALATARSLFHTYLLFLAHM